MCMPHSNILRIIVLRLFFWLKYENGWESRLWRLEDKHLREGSSVRQFGRPRPFRIRHRRRRRNMKIQRQSIHKTLSYNNTWSLLFRPHSLSLTGRILLFEYESATLLTVYNRTGHLNPGQIKEVMTWAATSWSIIKFTRPLVTQCAHSQVYVVTH